MPQLWPISGIKITKKSKALIKCQGKQKKWQTSKKRFEAVRKLILTCSSFHKFPQIYICNFSISFEPHKLIMGGADWIASNDRLQWRKTFQRKLKQLKENLYANEVILRWLHFQLITDVIAWEESESDREESEKLIQLDSKLLCTQCLFSHHDSRTSKPIIIFSCIMVLNF